MDGDGFSGASARRNCESVGIEGLCYLLSDSRPQRREICAALSENARSEAVFLPQQAEQQVLGSNVPMVQPVGFL